MRDGRDHRHLRAVRRADRLSFQEAGDRRREVATVFPMAAGHDDPAEALQETWDPVGAGLSALINSGVSGEAET